MVRGCCRPVRPSLKPGISLCDAHRYEMATRVSSADGDHVTAFAAGPETGRHICASRRRADADGPQKCDRRPACDSAASLDAFAR